MRRTMSPIFIRIKETGRHLKATPIEELPFSVLTEMLIGLQQEVTLRYFNLKLAEESNFHKKELLESLQKLSKILTCLDDKGLSQLWLSNQRNAVNYLVSQCELKTDGDRGVR